MRISTQKERFCWGI